MRTDFWLRPLDPLFFGPPRSFRAGEAHHASSAFPPSPWTMQGIVRTRLLESADRIYSLGDRSEAARREREALVGSPDALPHSWRLAPPVPVAATEDDRLEAWFPAPGFLFRRRYSPHEAPARARVLVDGTGRTPWRLVGDGADRGDTVVVGPPPDADSPKPLRGWVSAGNLHWALTGQGGWSPEGHRDDLPPFVRRERQAGVAIDDREGTAQDQMLYTIERLRFREGSGLWSSLHIERTGSRVDPAALLSGVAHAGSRARPVELGPAPAMSRNWQAVERGEGLLPELAGGASGERPASAIGVDGNVRVWLYLASPVHIDKDQDRPRVHTGAVPGVEVRVRAAFVGPPEVHGGFSMASGASRGNRMLVPAGSVWLIDLAGSRPDERAAILGGLHGGYPLADPSDENATAHAAFGFGRILVGIGPEPLSRDASAPVPGGEPME